MLIEKNEEKYERRGGDEIIMSILREMNDEELENIIRKAENINRSGSQFEKAQIELDIRRKRKLYELQKSMLTSIKFRLDKIIRLLEYVTKRPKQAVFIAATAVVGSGILVNVLSEIIIKLIQK